MRAVIEILQVFGITTQNSGYNKNQDNIPVKYLFHTFSFKTLESKSQVKTISTGCREPKMIQSLSVGVGIA